MPFTHAFDYLTSESDEAPAIVALFGSDATLRSWVVVAVTSTGDITQFDGESTRWSDLRDELSTASLFDMGGKRTIVVREADKFVSEHRKELEKYIAKPGQSARLLLDLGSLASNTRIYKSLLADHLLVGCSASPDKKSGVTAASRRKFLNGYVAKRHRTKIAAAASDALIEMMGEDIGMIDSEIAKLALYCAEGETIDEPLVREVVAGWQGKTIWQITDAIAAGNAAEALRQLDKLMTGGQRPIALLPQIAWSLRRLGMATAMVEHWERSGRKTKLKDALEAVGINRDVAGAERQLRGMGRARGLQLLGWLLDADLRLKGTHSQPGRDRFLLEQFVVKLAN